MVLHGKNVIPVMAVVISLARVIIGQCAMFVVVLVENLKERNSRETIVAVAINQGNLIISLPKPNRHGDLLKQLRKEDGWKFPIKQDEFGFLTNTGRFARRKPALSIAYKADQIKDKKHPPMDELLSEDLW